MPRFPFELTVRIANSSNQVNVHFDRPDQCPICHFKITPEGPVAAIRKYETLELVYLCANSDCKSLFISYYTRYGQTENFELRSSAPTNHRSREFSGVINKISPNFIEIYNQSFFAEEQQLFQICGVGYRKSIEFLIKDFLKLKKPERSSEIEKMFLGNCIEDLVDDPKIKEVAKRATWLGNDETHYIRKWVDKDLSHLKKLIDLTLHWIEIDHATDEMIREMPES